MIQSLLAMKTRVEYIDLAKGYGIIAIMAWHVHLAPFFSFHYMKFWVLPMFFLLSGVFAKTEMTFIELIKRDVTRFFVPMLFYNAIYFILNVLFTILLPDQYSFFNPIKKAINPFGFMNGPLWFVWALFFMDIIHWGLARFFENNHLKIFFSALILSAVVFHLNKFVIFNHHIRLPLNLDVALTSYLFYSLGFSLKDFILLKRPIPVFIHLLIVCGYIILNIYNSSDNRSMAVNAYDFNWFVFISKSLLGAFTFLFLFYVIEKLKVFSWLRWFGVKSLHFLGLHYVFIPCFLFVLPSLASIPSWEKYSFFILFILFSSLIVLLYDFYLKRTETCLGNKVTSFI